MSDPKPQKRLGILGWIAIGVVTVGAASLVPPLFPIKSAMSPQIRALSQAKQVGLALRLFAGDNDGHYPISSRNGGGNKSIPIFNGTAIDSNSAFRPLFPDYIPGEVIFYVRGSKWSPKPPDEHYDTHAEKLTPGENHWAYVPGLTDTSNPIFPLLADGFVEGKPGTYTTDPAKRGGLWRGVRAIVLRNDQSAYLERITRSPDGTLRVVGRFAPGPNEDIFSTISNGSRWIPFPPINPASP